MTNNKLWSPISKSNLSKFINTYSEKEFFKNYFDFHDWSIKNKKKFWNQVWDFTEIIGKKKGNILINQKDFIKSKFFNKSTLNYAENCLSKKDNSDAIIFYSEQKKTRKITWKNLREKVFKLSNYFKSKKIDQNDRIAGILPNIPETVISFLATSQIGAIWSSCSSDFGPKAIIDRFKQIEPRILLVADYYFYNNKKIETLAHIPKILSEIESIEEVIVIPYDGKNPKIIANFNYTNWNEIFKKNQKLEKFIQLPFNHPLYILYSSGTTGEPKCIVHGSGGTLIQHKKEHQLHCNIKKNDKVFYFTTCGWMMWNWLVSSLASKATILLYDGSPFLPTYDYLFKIADLEKIKFFGTGAKYIDFLKQKKIFIKKKYKLKKLEIIASTGSPLVHESFKYIYSNIKTDVQLASISGGTDLVSCFLIGNPMLPVYAGEIQCAGLGMDVDIFDDKGNSLCNKKGELVCKSTFPSKPLYFWNDKKNKKLKKSYFSKYKNIWHHGDYCEKTRNKGYIIHGRSDATLNSGGIRIGTAELYRVVENLVEIIECVAVEKQLKTDTKVILFIKLDEKYNLNNNLIDKIKLEIRNNLSPKYVPAKIFKINDIPKTKSGKIVELTIKSIINGKKIKNLSFLMNPKSLKEYKDICNLLNKSL